eukprot:m51a1_g14331 hypothetical protein (889) ;mRNA; f:115498-118995
MSGPPSECVYVPELLEAVRAQMRARGLDAYVVPSSDAHAGEYVAEHDKRRMALCAFSGSAGTALVTLARAALWTDGRYWAQATEQLPAGWELVKDRLDTTPTVAAWLQASPELAGRPELTVGVDPLLMTPSDVARLRAPGVAVALVAENLVDAAWPAPLRPPTPSARVWPLPPGATSRAPAAKLADLRRDVAQSGADACVVSELADVAWLFNVRGDDVPCTPVASAYAVVASDASDAPVVLFADAARFEQGALDNVRSAGAELRPYADALPYVRSLGEAGRKVWLDPGSVNCAFSEAVPAAQRVERRLPLAQRRAEKDADELSAARRSYAADGALVCAFLAWLAAEVRSGHAVSECDAVEQLERTRRGHAAYLGPSFHTIAGYGRNGAVIHYEARRGACADIGTESMLLLDTGGQYSYGGTTDTTRTVHFGQPSPEQRRAYTVVLKSHIALASATFPAGIHPHSGADACVVSELADVAWLFNVRGDDVPCTPVASAYAVVASDASDAPVVLFADAARFEQGALDNVRSAGAELRPYADALPYVRSLGEAGRKVWLDPGSVNCAFSEAVPAAQRVERRLPLAQRRAEKDADELSAARRSYAADGALVCAFLAWLAAEVRSGHAVSECDAVEQLERTRRGHAAYLGPSFHTIAGYGRNGAVIHYEARRGACADIGTESMLLLDTGGQYSYGGTTDTTRTVHFGQPSPEQRRAYTVVLKSHIALASATFPAGIHPHTLDVIAREVVWRYGLDYAHGTGHGVGACLSVHEAPTLSSSHTYEAPALAPNMLLTVEPGLYEEGFYGIRTESVGIVVPAADLPRPSARGQRFLRLDIVTRVPYQPSLIEGSMLTEAEREWVNAYNAMCLQELTPALAGDARALEWLRANTTPVVA